MPDIILFPSDFFNSKAVDDALKCEYGAAQTAGFQTVIFNYEKWFYEGRLMVSEKPLNETRTLYRGWMMKPDMYEKFYNELLRVNLRLVTPPQEYQLLHLFPNVYPMLEEDTAKMLIFPQGMEVSVDEIRQNFPRFMVKDYVKSVKGSQFPRYFDSTVAQNELDKWLEVFYKYRADLFTGGICVKEYLDLKRYDSKSNEYRVFYANRTILSGSRNSGQGEGAPMPPQTLLEKYKNLPAVFYTIDYAELEDGSWKALETGDGQVSGLSENQDCEAFFMGIKNCFEQMSHI